MVHASNNLPSTKGAIKKKPELKFTECQLPVPGTVPVAFTTFIISFKPSRNFCLMGFIYPILGDEAEPQRGCTTCRRTKHKLTGFWASSVATLPSP